MPSTPEYINECLSFLRRQVDVVHPRALVALGSIAATYLDRLDLAYVALKHPSDWIFRARKTREELLDAEGQKLRDFLKVSGGDFPSRSESKILWASKSHHRIPTDNLTHTDSVAGNSRKDAWGFRLKTASSFLMMAIEKGGKSKAEIRTEFDCLFPGSVGKSTFDVFFSDVARPFGSANASRCIRLPKEERVAIQIDPQRAHSIKSAIAAGMLKEINRLEPKRKFPKLFRREIDAIVEKYRAPLELDGKTQVAAAMS